jgi:hypothetical protein
MDEVLALMADQGRAAGLEVTRSASTRRRRTLVIEPRLFQVFRG